MKFKNERTLADFASCMPDDGEIFAEMLDSMRYFTRGENIPPWLDCKEEVISSWRWSFAYFLREARVPLIRNRV